MKDLVSRLRACVPKMTGVASAHCTDVEAVNMAVEEIERLRAALKEIQAYSVGDRLPRHIWYYDRAEAALTNGQSEVGK